MNFDNNPDGGFNFNAGLVDRQGNIEEGIDISGIDFSLSADAPDVNIISQDEKSSYTSYGRYGGLIGNRGVAFDPLKGELSRTNRFGNKTTVGPSANREIVNRVASDIRLSKATEKLEEQILMYIPSGLNFSDKVDYERGICWCLQCNQRSNFRNLGAGIDKLKLLGVEKLSSKAAKNIPTAGENDLQNFFRARLGFARESERIAVQRCW